MRITLKLHADALIAARRLAQHGQLSLGDAVSVLVRRGAAAGGSFCAAKASPALRGRSALPPVRDEVITPQHIRGLL